MRPMDVEEIRRAIHARRFTAGADVRVSGVSIDSRTAEAGDVFFAIRGERFDGHDFLAPAAEAGCAAAVADNRAEVPDALADAFPGGVLVAADTVKALGELASYCRRRLTATVVAVTGSNGKTTVKRMIGHILSRNLAGTCSPKSFNNAIGVPLTLLGAGAGDDYVVCEVGTNAPGEIAALGRMVRPEVAVITSVAASHLEGLGSIERVIGEKASLLASLAPDGLAVVWADNVHLVKAAGTYGRRMILFGESESAQLQLTAYEQAGWTQRFQLNGRWWVSLPVPGRHNATNALAAIAVAQRFGLSQAEAIDSLADYSAPDMRLERIEAGRITIINDAYNANPASFVAAADVLGECEAARKVVIAADMLELGDRSEELHVATGREIARHGPDLLIAVGRLGRYIAQGAGEAGIRTVTFDSLQQACKGVGDLLGAGDLVLVKGSRALGLEALIEPIRSCPAARAARRNER